MSWTAKKFKKNSKAILIIILIIVITVRIVTIVRIVIIAKSVKHIKGSRFEVPAKQFHLHGHGGAKPDEISRASSGASQCGSSKTCGNSFGLGFRV